MLKLQFKDRRQESIWLVDSQFTIGSAPENSLVINDASIDSFHAEINNERGDTTLTPVTNKRAISVNGLPVVAPSALKAGDVVAFGTVEMDVIDPQSTQYKSSIGLSPAKDQLWQLKSTASWMEDQLFPIEGKTVLGRDAECDISIPIEHLSRRHVELEVVAGRLNIKDLNSSNGTFLNGNRIQESHANAGDRIKVDVVTFEVVGPASDPNKTIIRPVNDASPQQKRPQKTPIKKDSTNKGSVNASIKKPSLASQGKQSWIANAETTKPKTNYWWFAIAGFTITVLGVIIISML